MKAFFNQKKIFHSFFLICLFCLSYKASGQTKREIIKWINTNGISLSQISNQSLYFSIQQVDKDSIYYVYKNTTEPSKKYSIALKDILYEDISTIEKKNNTDDRTITNFVIKVSRKETLFNKSKKMETVKFFLFPFESEEKTSRVVKAIMSLSKISGGKENKQFY